VAVLPLAASTVFSAATQLGPLAIFAVLYARRVRTLAAMRQAVPGWRQACFYGGCLTIAGALTSLGSASQETLWAHMVEHLLMGDIAALLLVLGLTGPLIAPILRISVFNRLRVLANPAIAFPLWAVDLYAWHLPVFYQAALRHTGVHALEHAMFIGFGMNMWMCLFGPLPMPRWFGGGAKVVYILAVRITETVLANIFVWSGTAFYPFYTAGEHRAHISPLSDQQLAGGVMMTEGSILTLCLFGWLFFTALREAEERQNLLELAHDCGVELSEERVTRAVRGGHGAELRRRLERARTGGSATAGTTATALQQRAATNGGS
jgi:putative membrane protein